MTSPTLPSLESLDLTGSSSPLVFVRVDFNVAIEDGRLVDDTRLRAALPTLEALLERGARLVVASHRGRPSGTPDPATSMEPVAAMLAERLGRPVHFAADCIGPERQRAQEALGDGEVLLLENLRFHAEEKANDPDFARQLVDGCDAYVNDAFGTAHRAHASVEAAARAAPARAAGRLMVKEVTTLRGLLEDPDRPFVAITGGAKISGKIDTLTRLVEAVDRLVVGGGMANTFLACPRPDREGLDLARSLVDRDSLDEAQQILARAEERGVDVLLPTDVVVTDDLAAQEPRVEVVEVTTIPEWALAVDIGPETRKRYREAIQDAGSVFWNGPMGVFEKEAFADGSLEVARAVAECPGFTVMGGGETAAVAALAGIEERLDHVSTGGGASLELLAGASLPGVVALTSVASANQET